MSTSYYKKLPKSQIEISFEIPADEFKQYIDEAVTILGKDFSAAGFRNGKVPREILEKSLPYEKVMEEVVDHAVKHSYVQKVHELAESETEKIEIIGRPEIQITKFAKGSPLEFKATASFLPDFVLPDYKKIASKIKPREVSVGEKDIEESLNFLQKSRAKTVEKPQNEPCQKGDFIAITFSAPQIENNKEQKDNFVMGDGNFIPGFEEAILGMKINEEKSFSLTFPEKYFKEELSGKKVDFKAKVNSIAKIELPEMTDELAKSFGDFENLEKFKNSVKEGLSAEKKESAKQARRAEILEKICGESQIEIPDILVLWTRSIRPV